MSPVEQLVRRLSEIQDLLSGLPNDAFEERAALLAERAELQCRASEHAAGADRERPTEDLLKELEALRVRNEREVASEVQTLRTVTRINRLTGILSARGISYYTY